MRVDVALTSEDLDRAALASATVLVIDVLRASTTMIAALDNGCAGIVPVAEPGEALTRVRAMGGTALVAGERRGRTIEGFDLGNSPLEVTRARVGDRMLVFTTSNGTRAMLAARSAAAVGVAAFVNASAAVAWALAGGRDVTVLCAGERGAHSLEDTVCAGLLVDGLVRTAPRAEITAVARDAREAWRRYGEAIGRLAFDSPWARHLALSGRREDVEACLVLDTTTLVPVWGGDAVRAPGRRGTGAPGGRGEPMNIDNVIGGSR